MNKQLGYQLFFAIIILILLVLAANPFHFWMPSPVIMLLVCSISIAFFIFASFVFKENSHDEREQLHSLISGRISFLIGSSILAIATVVKELQGQPDPWIIGALGTMVLTKILTRIYVEIKH